MGCLSDSVLNQDDDNKVVDRLLEIHDKEHDNKNTLTQPAEGDDDNTLTVAEEDEVYEPYGYWKGRPKGPHDYRVPKPPVLSVQSDMSVHEKPTDSAQPGVRRPPTSVHVRPTVSAQPGVRRSPESCHTPGPSMEARLGGEGRRGLEDEFCTLPKFKGTAHNETSDTACRIE